MVLGNTLNILRPPERATMPVQTKWNEDLVKNMHNVLGEISQQLTTTTTVSVASLTHYTTKAALEAATVPAIVEAIQLSGHLATGDGGAALYKRVGADPSPKLRVQSTDGAWWELVPDQGGLNVMQAGAVGDGTADDTTELQAAFDALGEGDTIVFPSGKTYLISSAITLTSVDFVTVIGYGATIKEVGLALVDHLKFTSCDNLLVLGLYFTATETHAGFVADNPGDERQFMRFLTCDDVSVYHVGGTNKRTLILAHQSVRFTVEDFSFRGFFQDVSLGAQSDANSTPVIAIRQSHYATVTHGKVRNIGSGVLLYNSSRHAAISHIKVTEAHDNGVYVSSGGECSIEQCGIENVIGDGIKTRGSNMSIEGNKLRNCGVNGLSSAIAVTGLDIPDPENQNAGGYGISIIGNNIFDSAIGIRVSDVNSIYPRDVIITGNTLYNCTRSGELGAMLITINRGLIVGFNNIRKYATDFAIVVNGPLPGGAGQLTDTFVDGDVTVGTDRITLTAHPFDDFQAVQLSSSGTLPAGLVTTTVYYVKEIDVNTIELYLEARLVNIIDITAAAGGGTHTINHMSLVGVTIEGNICESGTGNPSSSRAAIKIIHCAASLKVISNSFADLPSNIGIRLQDCHGGIIANNEFPGGQVCRIPAGENNEGIYVYGNQGNSVSLDYTKNFGGENDTVLPSGTNSGVATISNATTSEVVSHLLAYTPNAQEISVHAIETLASASFFWVDTITATQFTIKVNADPTQDVDFAWSARRIN